MEQKEEKVEEGVVEDIPAKGSKSSWLAEIDLLDLAIGIFVACYGIALIVEAFKK